MLDLTIADNHGGGAHRVRKAAVKLDASRRSLFVRGEALEAAVSDGFLARLQFLFGTREQADAAFAAAYPVLRDGANRTHELDLLALYVLVLSVVCG
jgi:hypothetical protein